MSENNDGMTRGMQDYIDKNNKYLAERADYIEKTVKKWKFDTIAVHGLYSVTDALKDYQGAIIEPIFMSTSQAYSDSDEMAAALAYKIPTWCYSRIANPSTYYYEWTLALLEGYGFDGATSCCSTSSGMAAIMTAVQPFLRVLTKAGEPRNFVATAQCYGGTFQQFSVRLMQERNIECRWVKDATNLDEWAAKIDKNTRFLYGELPSNPQLGFFDIEAVADLAHSHNLPLICDSTVATPALLRPICHGADIVVQSVTKSLTSSGFGICGAVIARKNLVTNIDDEATQGRLFLRRQIPAKPRFRPQPPPHAGGHDPQRHAHPPLQDGPDEPQHRKGRRIPAEHLDVESVQYLGLKNHPLHQLAAKYMWLVDAEFDEQYNRPVNRYGHLMSFCVKGGVEKTRKFFDSLQRIWRATDLGRIKSVATIPAISTHQQQGEEGRALAGIPANMVRLCVGAEHPTTSSPTSIRPCLPRETAEKNPCIYLQPSE